MTQQKVAPYGSWKSAITPDFIVTDTIRLGQITLDGEDIYWLEMRPEEGGRYVIVQWSPGGEPIDIIPPPLNAQTRVHEYGGGSFFVNSGVVYFSNFEDQRLYKIDPGKEPTPITPEKAYRYTDGLFDTKRGRLICVREDHTVPDSETVNTLISLVLDGSREMAVLASGNDFYSSPRLSPDGSQLAWLTWNHPNMPWDGTELWVAKVQSNGSLGKARKAAGGFEESIFQPEWSPDGRLYFISDRTGWWNLYRWPEGQIEPLCPKAAEFGTPQWGFGMSTYGIESSQRIICTFHHQGNTYLASLDTSTGALEQIETPFTWFADVRVTGGRVLLMAGSPTEGVCIIQLDPTTHEYEVLRCESETSIDSGYISTPQSVEFPTENSQSAYAFFYPPHNKDFVAPPEEKPPLLVFSHGGPTGATTSLYNPSIQYWTSRGVAVLDVNYGGSAGYGRAYRKRLEGQWGVVDMDDCVNGARYLVDRGKVDGDRLAIRGASAGGYTTLAVLTFRDVFKAGASYFGVSDLGALAEDTHKFESRYLDKLIGPYPERRDLYIERSPIHHVDQLLCPVIFFQGLEDKVVPPNQAEMMVEALRAKGVPVAYLTFEGEQHGFRRAENIKRSLEAELYFYSMILGFDLSDEVEPVEIENL